MLPLLSRTPRCGPSRRASLRIGVDGDIRFNTGPPNDEPTIGSASDVPCVCNRMMSLESPRNLKTPQCCRCRQRKRSIFTAQMDRPSRPYDNRPFQSEAWRHHPLQVNVEAFVFPTYATAVVDPDTMLLDKSLMVRSFRLAL